MDSISDAGAVKDRLDLILSHPFHRSCGLELDRLQEGRAICRFMLNDFTINPFGALHGGILYALLDTVSLIALLPMLGEDEHAVSHDVHYSIMRPVTRDYTVELEANVRRRGRTVAFIQGEMRRCVDSRNELAATGTVTKTILGRHHG